MILFHEGKGEGGRVLKKPFLCKNRKQVLFGESSNDLVHPGEADMHGHLVMHTANEGPVRIQYKCLVPRSETVQPSYFQNRIIIFCLPIPTPIYLWEIYIFPDRCGLILGIYKLLTDTWMNVEIGTEAG